MDAPPTRPGTDKALEKSAKAPAPPADDLNAFAEEMDFLGVRPLPERDPTAHNPDRGSPARSSPAGGLSREERDRAAFLEAVGTMSTTFADDWQDAESARQAAPRRIRQVARGLLKPEAELDLHGLTATEAMAKVRFFLQDARHRRLQTLLIITGMGLHSKDGPVLRQALEKLLGQMPELVLEWAIAPRRYGGDGAVVVFLRSPAAE